VNQSGETFKKIESAVQTVTALIASITEASNEQARGISEINSAVSQMDEATQQNAALVEENTAAARSLSDQADQLQILMKFFKTGTQNSSSYVPSYTPKPSAAPRPSSAPSYSFTAKKVTAAPKPAASSSSGSDGWEEF
jgi:uncharacterized phage infection (PIP) family protein YhgE